MVRRAYRERSLVEVLLPDSDELWESVPGHRYTSGGRRPRRSHRPGPGPAPSAEPAGRPPRDTATVVLRMLVLKHLYDSSFDVCEREVRGGLVYRAFCRIDGERVPDAKTLIRLAHLLDEGSQGCRRPAGRLGRHQR
jgi:Transposase domain (DUF772)